MASNTPPTLVVADDEPEPRRIVQKAAERFGFEVIPCATIASATDAIEAALANKRLVGVVSDLKITADNDDGWGVLSFAFERSKTVRLALFTAFPDQPVQSLFRSGAAVPAFQIFRKMADIEKLKAWLRNTWDWSQERVALSLKDADTKRTYEVLAPIYARSTLPILILGESGTGKESLAERIHSASLRPGQMLSINCGGLEPSLAFSELFGHTANAFTDANFHELGILLRASGYSTPGRKASGNSQNFEQWLQEGNSDLRLDDKGVLGSESAKTASTTLFLDEVATLPQKVMAGLLRVLSSADISPVGHYGPRIRTYCRIVAATNEVSILEKSLSQRPDEQISFRRDLCYRLGGAIMTLPPLRDRDPEDIRNFVERSVWGQVDIQQMAVDTACLDYVVRLYKSRSDGTAHQYQMGNFRTLRDLIWRAALIATNDGAGSITKEHMEIAVQHGRLIVDDSESINQEKHIRETFRRALQRRGMLLDENFGWDVLREKTKRAPTEVAYGFLRCCLETRIGPSGGYYSFAELQTALAKGVVRGAWLGKTLSTESILNAVKLYFKVDTSTWSPTIQPAEIAEEIRSNSEER